MKIKYLRLTKEQRKKVKETYYNTPKGKALKSKLRLVLVSIIGLIICAIAILIDAIINKGSTWDYIYAACLGLIAICFIVVSYNLRIKRLNNYLINNKLKL